VAEHHERTGSDVAARLLADWDASLERFVKVMPHDYKRALEELKRGETERLTADEHAGAVAAA
jgi:glutamate synthase (NADPH) large chain